MRQQPGPYKKERHGDGKLLAGLRREREKLKKGTNEKNENKGAGGSPGSDSPSSELFFETPDRDALRRDRARAERQDAARTTVAREKKRVLMRFCVTGLNL
jgi:hypothetical protein